MSQATICLRALAALSHVAGTEEARFYLKGVHVEFSPHGVTYVATDGHALIATKVEGVECSLSGAITIPADVCQSFKVKPRANAEAILTALEDGAYSLTYGAQSILFKPVDGSYPDWRRIVPTEAATGVAAAYDPSIIARLSKASKALGAGGKAFVSPNGNCPGLVSFPDFPEAFGLIMPYRAPLMETVPAWVHAKPAEAMPLAAE